MTRSEWTVVWSKWRERAQEEFRVQWVVDQQWLSKPRPVTGFEPCPLCGKWYGYHYDDGYCLFNGRRVYSPLPYVERIRVIAVMTGQQLTTEFYKQQVKELIENGILNEVTVQAEQVAGSELEDSGLEPESC